MEQRKDWAQARRCKEPSSLGTQGDQEQMRPHDCYGLVLEKMVICPHNATTTCHHIERGPLEQSSKWDPSSDFLLVLKDSLRVSQAERELFQKVLDAKNEIAKCIFFHSEGNIWNESLGLAMRACFEFSCAIVPDRCLPEVMSIKRGKVVETNWNISTLDSALVDVFQAFQGRKRGYWTIQG